jgi:putative SOS response-associated peptidase YedK
MCGRFNLTDSPAIHALLDDLGIDIGPLPTRYNIAPTDPIATIFHDEEAGYTIGDMRWWLTPNWSDGPSQKYAMFNARAENIESSRAYKGPFRHHRAIIPASSFIEWKKTDTGKQPYEINPTEGCFLFAAVWDFWTNGDAQLYSCSILTTAATASFEYVHHRQPVMLNPQQARDWIQPNQDKTLLKELLQPQIPNELQATPVETSINNAKNKSKSVPAGKPKILAG